VPEVASLPQYWYAHRLSKIRAYEGWRRAEDASEAVGGALQDDTVVYLAEDLIVRLGPFSDADQVFAEDSRQWREFCADKLGYRVPDWDEETKEVRRIFGNG
jgi:hypothetical protein